MKLRTYYIIAILLSLFPLTTFADEIYYCHTDNFGTVMAMTDESGEVVWRTDELPFGEDYQQPEEIPIKNDRRFLGKQLDEKTGLIYMGARYFDPKTGRFNRPDPVGLVDPATGEINQKMLLDPQRQNRYAYGLNNPFRFVDPDGNSPIGMEEGAAVQAAINKDAQRIASRGIQRGKQFVDIAVTVASDGMLRAVPGKPGKWSRAPKSIHDQMVLDAAKKGAGTRIIQGLNDPKFKGMDKWQYKVKSSQGKDSVVHYVKDPKAKKSMDFKFKKHSTE